MFGGRFAEALLIREFWYLVRSSEKAVNDPPGTAAAAVAAGAAAGRIWGRAGAGTAAEEVAGRPGRTIRGGRIAGELLILSNSESGSDVNTSAIFALGQNAAELLDGMSPEIQDSSYCRAKENESSSYSRTWNCCCCCGRKGELGAGSGCWAYPPCKLRLFTVHSEKE